MFKKTIKYTVPEFESLKEKFRAEAEMSENGMVIKVGELTARNRSLGGWPVRLAFLGQDVNSMWVVSSTNENDGDLKEALMFLRLDKDAIINKMVKHEALKGMSEGDKELALASALEEKAHDIRAKAMSPR